MKQAVQTASRDRDLGNSDAFVLVVMSHGSRGAVYGTDCRRVEINDLTDILSTSNCLALENKPKIFIIQACQAGQYYCTLDVDFSSSIT